MAFKSLFSTLLVSIPLATMLLLGTAESFAVNKFPCTTQPTATSVPLRMTVPDGDESTKSSTSESISAPAAEDGESEDDIFEKVEMMGAGAAKAKRGKRKAASGGSADSVAPIKTTLAPEEVFFEGPPAITETIVPTISILTVIGIIPAAAAWARQAWVRYRITNRRIRVTSGIGGNEMAEIVYPDIVEIRTAKRLFGDGDLVAFLRDGARFEMRNIPEFESAVEYILNQVDPDVAATYRMKGDVTN